MKNLVRSILFFNFVFIFLQPISAQEISKAHYVTAKEYLKQDSLSMALIELDSATKITPNFADAYVLKATILERKKEYRQAIDQYNLAILHNPNLVSVYLSRAALHFMLKDHRDYMLNDVNKAILLEPNRAELYELKAYYYGHTLNPATLSPDYESAIMALSTAIKLEPMAGQYLKERSEFKLKNNQRLSALLDINLAIKLRNNDDTYYHLKGIIRFTMGDFRASLNDINRAIELNNNSVAYYQFRGNVYYNLKKYDQAYTNYSTSINLLFKKIAQTKMRLKPNSTLNLKLRQTLLLRGMSLVQANKPFDGCDDFNRALQMGESKAVNYIRQYCQ